MARRSSLSACLIVRDESDVIDACLMSLQAVVDEIVVVDTGSNDDTVARARRYPISLHHFEWCDDFSAARNVAIEKATGDWILYIDADERAAVANLSGLRAILEDPMAIAATVRLHPRTGFTAYTELRLFRRHPRIRFAGVIHERVHESVWALCRSADGTIEMSDMVLRHVGYDDDQSHKHPRNLPLLKAYLAADPSRIYCWWHLGDTYRQLGNLAAAQEAWEKGVAELRRRRCEPRLEESLVYASLVQLLHEAGHPVRALLDEARRLFPTQLQLQWIEAKIALEEGAQEGAAEVFARLSALDPDTFFDPLISYDKRLFGLWSVEALALCHFRAGRYAEAAAQYRIAAGLDPDDPSLSLKAELAAARAQAGGML